MRDPKTPIVVCTSTDCDICGTEYSGIGDRGDEQLRDAVPGGDGGRRGAGEVREQDDDLPQDPDRGLHVHGLRHLRHRVQRGDRAMSTWTKDRRSG
jgi:hypothetical protein